MLVYKIQAVTSTRIKFEAGRRNKLPTITAAIIAQIKLH